MTVPSASTSSAVGLGSGQAFPAVLIPEASWTISLDLIAVWPHGIQDSARPAKLPDEWEMTLVEVCCGNRNVNRPRRTKAQTDQEFSGTEDGARREWRAGLFRSPGEWNA
jgi:hypothetical protein